MQLILNPRTKQQVANFLKDPMHAVLLLGPVGSGKGFLAKYVASEVLGISKEKLSNYAYFLQILPEEKSISIEQVRRLHSFSSLKTAGKNNIRRVIIIENIQTMTIEAQNAFLKLLEEPPADTVFILTAADSRSILPTILSRMQKINVLVPSASKMQTHFRDLGFSDPAVDKALLVANGSPGLAKAILEADKKHELILQIETAKQLLGLTLFERLAEVNSLAAKKDELPALLLALQRVAKAMVTQAAEKDDGARLVQWHHRLKKITEAQTALVSNPQPKLLLTDLFLNL